MKFDLLTLPQTVTRFYNRRFEPLLERHGLTRMEMDLLLFLANNPEYDTAAQAVSVRHLSKSQVSTSVDALVRRGFLERRPDGADRRTVHLAVLPAAAGAVAEGQGTQQAVVDALLTGVVAQDRRAFGRVLNAMLRNVKESEA